MPRGLDPGPRVGKQLQTWEVSCPCYDRHGVPVVEYIVQVQGLWTLLPVFTWLVGQRRSTFVEHCLFFKFVIHLTLFGLLLMHSHFQYDANY